MNLNIKIGEIKKNNEGLYSEMQIFKGQEKLLQKQITDTGLKVEELKHQRDIFKKSIEVLELIQKNNYNRIKEGFENIVSYALQYIYDDKEYGLKLEFKRRGNLSELLLNTMSPGFVDFYEPMDCEAGSFLDISAVALRIALLELSIPKNKGFLIFDESFKALSDNLMENAGLFLKTINQKMGRQIIFITHRKKLVECADNIIEIGENEKEI